ncbi:hypothetical protein [uncultured Oxalobacter sp.]|uniref:hypothetical protein n=1 Tax=uncultured Oxalobacter sp. TaxID=337245 RepID=UPI00259147F0|nr:hypothetical protein [uncultured Oxalobacter sp.]
MTKQTEKRSWKMEKDWTGSAMPSVLKGFAMIGQPIRADEFEKAFGYKMPEITLSEEEKRRVVQNNGLEPAIRQAENQPVAKTEQQELNFGREVLARIQAGSTLQAEQQEQKEQEQEPPLQIGIRGVGNSQPEEDITGNAQTNRNGSGTIKIDDPYAAKTLEQLKKQGNPTNSVPFQNRASSVQEGTPAKTLELKNPLSYTRKGETNLLAINNQNPNAQTGPNETGSVPLNYLLEIGQNENADNIAAQPDPEGKHPNALETIRQGVNRATGELAGKTADIRRQQQETEDENHLLNWTADVAQNAMQNPVTHSRQDYQPAYQAILGHDANRKLAEAAAEPIETDVNGKEKYEIVRDAFIQEYDTETSKQVMALGSLINHAIATINDGQPINPEVVSEVDDKMIDLIGQSDRYIAQSVPIEKLAKQVVKGDDPQTAENATRFFYETLGGKGPYMLAGTAGGSLLAGAGMAGGVATIQKMTKDFTVNLAEANANIVKETGSHNWELAFKIALQTTIGGRTIDTQMERAAKGRGAGNKTFMKIIGDALKKRFSSMLNEFHLQKGQYEKNKTQE